MSQWAHSHANERSFSTAIEMLAACVHVRVHVPGQDRGERLLFGLLPGSFSLGSCFLNRMSYSRHLSPQPQKQVNICFTVHALGDGGGGGPAPFANPLGTVFFRCAPNMTLIDQSSDDQGETVSSASPPCSSCACVSFCGVFCYFQDHSRGRVFRG